MDALTVFLTGLKAWAPTAATVILIPLIIWLNSQIQKNEKDNCARDAAMKTEFADQMEGLKKSVIDQLEKYQDETNKRFDEHERRIRILEQDAVRKEEFLRTTSGWRTEINRLSDLIMTQMTGISNKIIDLWRDKGKGE
jgi:hypothetical protein